MVAANTQTSSHTRWDCLWASCFFSSCFIYNSWFSHFTALLEFHCVFLNKVALYPRLIRGRRRVGHMLTHSTSKSPACRALFTPAGLNLAQSRITSTRLKRRGDNVVWLLHICWPKVEKPWWWTEGLQSNILYVVVQLLLCFFHFISFQNLISSLLTVLQPSFHSYCQTQDKLLSESGQPRLFNIKYKKRHVYWRVTAHSWESH